MNNSRDKQKLFNLAGNSTDTDDSGIIPNQNRLMIRKVGLSCQSLADMTGVSLTVRFGSPGSFQDVRSFFTCGNTIEVIINKRFTGDGVKFFRIIAKNYSLTARDVSWWIEAYDA